MKKLEPAVELAVQKNHQEFRNKHPEFVFKEDPSVRHFREITSVTVANEMARETKFYVPVVDSSHRKYLAPFIIKTKRLLRKVAKPFLKILFVRQERMNDLTVSLAYGVASLEMRLMKIEEHMKKEVKS